jgi:triosephosphate isomerase
MSVKNKLIVANWKMHKSYIEGLLLANAVVAGLEKFTGPVDVVLCPPFIHLQTVSSMLKDYLRLHSGAQNCHHIEEGAFTGEVSAKMLKSVGAEYVIIGHSERRIYQNETSEMIEGKVKLVLSAGLKPIFCCGEPLEIRDKNQHLEFVESQLEQSLFKLNPEEFQNIIIAYEPIWAIGTGKVASPEQAQEMHAHIRKLISLKYGDDLAKNLVILYGGSCNAQNSIDLFGQNDIDGALVGSASLIAADFLQIVKNAALSTHT